MRRIAIRFRRHADFEKLADQLDVRRRVERERQRAKRFEALTGHRSYRKPATAREALDYSTQRSGTQFDAEMVRC